MKKRGLTLRLVFLSGLIFFLVVFSAFAFWTMLRVPQHVDPNLVAESWTVVDDGLHNAFTDLVYWKGNFYLVFRSASSHLDRNSKLVVMRSANARNWEKLAELRMEGKDIRDPKLAAIGDHLFLYALINTSLVPRPDTTIFSTSEDGKTWEPFQDLQPRGWLFWRPQTDDHKTWYAPAYSSQHDQTALFQSQDGVKWEKVSLIYSGEPQSEVEVIFKTEGSLVGTIRLGGRAGLPASTLVTWSDFPFQSWSSVHSPVTRLDGPGLFLYHGLMFAAGRSEPAEGVLFGARGGLLNKKRTSIFRLSSTGLKELTGLPSNGDTSYPGIVIMGDEGYISYYSSEIGQDLPWLVGQFSRSSIRIARLNLPALERVAKNLP